MDAAWSEDERPVVGIVNSETATGIGTELVGNVSDDSGSRSIRAEDSLDAVLDAHDATALRGNLEDVLAAAPSLLVTGGERDLSAVARAGFDGPVLPVGDISGIDAVARAQLPAALGAVLEGTATVSERSLLEVDVEGDDAGDGTSDDTDETRERALFDVTLVTDEPARISEYSVESRGDALATFRADGVVVATPAGSHGYASAVDAPHLASAVDAVAVAPIAPFVTQTRRWVLPDDSVTLAVERDEGDVTLVVDDRSVDAIGVGSRVSITADGTLSTLSVPDDALESN
ncbi:NAD(+)/NADH kinase [Natronorubrum halophilum]|uniref:NAD(+)/NADH kinase n=1 Tax=Natronorubrum halophilum TaxID=1702106 RepID=UPI0010C1960D|nr:NAD(+)/NADH kinase [Natronorubrum halophilum]